MIELRPYEDLAAHAVLTRLDVADQMEAGLVRGAAAAGLALFADWRSIQGLCVGSVVICAAGTPFAVACLSHTGQAGVVQAAFLARDHRRFRLPIARAAVAIRAGLPEFCAARGIRRIEARCWADHPTAPDFLYSLGFAPEAVMDGFGASGAVRFVQYARVLAAISPAPASPLSPAEERT